MERQLDQIQHLAALMPSSCIWPTIPLASQTGD